MMGEQFSDYLGWTVWQCVAGSRGGAGPGDCKRWDLRRDGWPRQPTTVEVAAARLWALHEFKPLAKACGLDVDDNPQTSRIRGLAPAAGSASTADGIASLLHAPLIPPFLRDVEPRPGSLTEGANLRQLHALLGGRGKLEGGLVRPGISPTSQEAIVERAIRSLYDWRATLRFLSELRRVEGDRLTLVEPDAAIIDGFNVHITRDRRPNLIHTMLAHLAEPARIRVLLTTNFDTLIEDAFAQQRRRLEAISVSIRGELPDPEIVHSRDTVVKLHGTFTETRADFSLDESPPLRERRRFFDYVRGGPPQDGHDLRDAKEGRFSPSQLLVAGYSGSDKRCVELMKFVLDGDPEACLFWVCNSERDEAWLSALFTEAGYRGRVIATTTARFDLLLYEFHQHLCLSLPPDGSAYPGSYQIKDSTPPEHSFRPPREAATLSAAAAQIVDELARCGLLVVDGPSGISQPIGDAFRHLTRRAGFNGVWLELEDYPNSESVACEVFQIIASKRGIAHLRHAQWTPRWHESEQQSAGERLDVWRSHIERVKEHLEFEPTRWVIALHGRNGPGGCSGWEENAFWDPSVEYDRGHAPGHFAVLLAALVHAGFKLLYAPYSRQKRLHDEARERDVQDAIARWHGPGKPVHVAAELPGVHECEALPGAFAQLGMNAESLLHVDLGSRLSPDRSDAERYRRAMQAFLHRHLYIDRCEALDSERVSTLRGRFNLIYGASLFRQSRHYTAFLIEGLISCPDRFNAFGFDNDLRRRRLLEMVLSELNEPPRIFHRKPGGFAWSYRDMRFAMRGLAASVSRAVYEDEQDADRQPRLLPCDSLRARTHFWIADWYTRAFYVSNHVSPLMEAAYHCYQCVKQSKYARSVAWHKTGEAGQLAYRLHWWLLGLNQLLKTLRLGGAGIPVVARSRHEPNPVWRDSGQGNSPDAA